MCKTPFGRDRTYTSSALSISSSPENNVVVNMGTAPAKPVIILNFDSATSVTAVNVKRIDSDGNTLEEIEYAGTVTAGDAFKFDSETKTVRKNGIPVAFIGGFPKVEPGANIIQITVTGSAFSLYATYKVKNTWM